MEYSFSKGGAQCERCERPFLADDPFFSIILLGETEPERLDVCPTCFEGRDPDRSREFAYWRTRRLDDGRSRRIVDFKALRELFFRMAEQHGGEYLKINYLLGLVLIRKRSIRLKEFVTEGGVDYLVVTTKERSEPLRLEAPELRAEEISELRDKLRMLLDIDFEEENGLAADPAILDDQAPAAEVAAEDPPPGAAPA